MAVSSPRAAGGGQQGCQSQAEVTQAAYHLEDLNRITGNSTPEAA
jgi:hypothetical protein